MLHLDIPRLLANAYQARGILFGNRLQQRSVRKQNCLSPNLKQESKRGDEKGGRRMVCPGPRLGEELSVPQVQSDSWFGQQLNCTKTGSQRPTPPLDMEALSRHHDWETSPPRNRPIPSQSTHHKPVAVSSTSEFCFEKRKVFSFTNLDPTRFSITEEGDKRFLAPLDA